MKKSKLFCKLLSALSAISMACSVSVGFVGAFDTKNIVENCLNNSLYRWELCPEHYEFMHNLGFENYEEFRALVKPVLGEEFFRNNAYNISGRDDSVQFVCLIKLICDTSAGFDKENLIKKLIAERNREERREDKIVAKMVSADLGVLVTRLCADTKIISYGG